jgi:hypothetical protein
MKDNKVKQVLPRNVFQWEGEGHEESVKESKCDEIYFVKKQVGVAVWIHIWVFNSTVLHVCFCTSVDLFAQYCLGYLQSFVLLTEL